MKSQSKLSGSGIGRPLILCLAAFLAAMTPTIIHAQSSLGPVPPEALLSEEWKTATPETAPVYQWDRSSKIPSVAPSAGAAIWVEQGPGPILFDSNTRLPPDNPASGAVNAIAPSPTNPNLLYIGTVNGGIWRTTNLTASNPNWTPLTDQQLPALSIRSLAISPANPNVIFAGTGS